MCLHDAQEVDTSTPGQNATTLSKCKRLTGKATCTFMDTDVHGRQSVVATSSGGARTARAFPRLAATHRAGAATRTAIAICAATDARKLSLVCLQRGRCSELGGADQGDQGDNEAMCHRVVP